MVSGTLSVINLLLIIICFFIIGAAIWRCIPFSSNIKTLSYMKYATSNKTAIQKSSECACIYCFSKFEPSAITEWIYGFEKDKDPTACCPECYVDSVIPNSLIDYKEKDLTSWNEEGFGE